MRYSVLVLSIVIALSKQALSQTATAGANDGYTDRIVTDQRAYTSASYDDSMCFYLPQIAGGLLSAEKFLPAYDTLRFYIEHCYSDPEAWSYFVAIGMTCGDLASVGDTLWASYRQWLLKVLYLNPDTDYYCHDLNEYAGTFVHADELGHPADYRTTLAIRKYLGDSSQCAFIKRGFPSDFAAYHKMWRDTVTDSLKTPFDTTLPSIDEIGQQFLRGFSGVIAAAEVASGSLGTLRAQKNPFSGDAELAYTTNLPTVAKLEVYDALGHMLWTDGQGYLDPGEHHQRIPTTGWAAGTYYARLTTLKGEVKTVKVVFEK